MLGAKLPMAGEGGVLLPQLPGTREPDFAPPSSSDDGVFLLAIPLFYDVTV